MGTGSGGLLGALLQFLTPPPLIYGVAVAATYMRVVPHFSERTLHDSGVPDPVIFGVVEVSVTASQVGTIA